MSDRGRKSADARLIAAARAVIPGTQLAGALQVDLVDIADILTNNTLSLGNSGAHEVKDAQGDHDVQFAARGSDIVWGASADPCWYLVTEFLDISVSDAGAGDIYHITTSAVPAVSFTPDGSGPTFGHFFMQNFGDTSGSLDGQSSLSTLFWLPGGDDFVPGTAASWRAKCQNSAGRHISNVTWSLGILRFIPASS